MNQSGARVVVAGSINMDVVALVDRHPGPGETVTGTDLFRVPGGKGANQAVAASGAGSNVVLFGSVGDDAFGAEILAFLQSRRIDVARIARRVGTPTGTALILVDALGENEIVVIAGANGTVDPDLVSTVEPRPSDVLVAQFETPVGATMAFFERGHAVGATCVLNPAPAGPIPDDLLRVVDFLIVNETELGRVAGELDSAAPSAEPVRAAAAALRQRGFRGVVVATLGARGSITLVGDRTVEVEGRMVEAVDTTGAGDCFVGFFAAELARGTDIDGALQTANVAASLCVQRPGAGPSMPTSTDVYRAMDAHR